MTAEDEALQYTHSGQRYLLGYGRDFFGIWDREQPGPPIQRFPRTDEGWRDAWIAYAAEEPHSVDVGLSGTHSRSTGASGPPPVSRSPVGRPAPVNARPRPLVSPAWWLLPIFLGLVGGIVAWLFVRPADPRAGRLMLIVGAISSLLAYALFASSLPSR